MADNYLDMHLLMYLIEINLLRPTQEVKELHALRFFGVRPRRQQLCASPETRPPDGSATSHETCGQFPAGLLTFVRIPAGCVLALLLMFLTE